VKLRPSSKVTVTVEASSITWSFVTTQPAGSMMKPEPSDCTLRSGCCEPPNCFRNSSSNGEPGGNSGNGPGIPESDRRNVFRRLHRLEASRTTPGSGLGLSLVAAVAELHGIRFELGDNRLGLCVTLHLPPAA
jgi:hypothetical protein